MTRYHGILAPNDKHRKFIVPKIPAPVADASPDKLDDKLTEPPPKSRITWARLLKRVFNIDVEVCADCGGKAKVIAAIEDPIVIRKILSHLGLPTKAPVIHPTRSRGPPAGLSPDDDYSQAPAFDFD